MFEYLAWKATRTAEDSQTAEKQTEASEGKSGTSEMGEAGIGAADKGDVEMGAAEDNGDAGMSEVAKGKRKRENTPEQVEQVQKVKSKLCFGEIWLNLFSQRRSSLRQKSVTFQVSSPAETQEQEKKLSGETPKSSEFIEDSDPAEVCILTSSVMQTTNFIHLLRTFPQSGWKHPPTKKPQMQWRRNCW